MPMNLSPEFQKAFRGYKVEEVEEFVSQISVAYEQIRKDLFSCKEENDKAKKQVDYFLALEGSLNKALVSAQQKADEIINTANEEVNRSLVDSRERLENINNEIDKILADANEQATRIEEEANQKAEQILTNIKEQVASEASRYAETGIKVEKMRNDLTMAVRAFLQQLEGMSRSDLEIGKGPDDLSNPNW